MTLPASGSISMNQVLGELQIGNPSRTNPIVLGDTDVRALAGVASGAISMSSLYGKSGGSTLAATPSNAGGAFSSKLSGGTATCSPSVAAFNGTPPYSYLWTFTSNPNTCTLSNATSAACTVSKAFSINTNGSASAVLNCRVTDNAATVINKSGITATLNWDNGA